MTDTKLEQQAEAVQETLVDAVKFLMRQGREGLLLADRLNQKVPTITAALAAQQGGSDNDR